MTAAHARAAAGLFGLTGVALGAFGAHALAGRLGPDDLATFETATRYQLIHAVALLALGSRLEERPEPGLAWGARLLTFGVAIFSGSLYFLVLTGPRWLGAITPFGGVAMIAGWALVALEGWRGARRDRAGPSR